jgi:CheY-like chemotaxis protein
MATTTLEAEAGAAEVEPVTARKSLRVLIVEDEAISAICFEEAVHSLGHVVVETADTGNRAIAAAERHRPDLVLMDVRLRDGTDGVEAANVIRENWDIPSIFVTANSDPVTLARTKAARPLIDPLIKPVSPTLIRYALDHAAALLARAPQPCGAVDG